MSQIQVFCKMLKEKLEEVHRGRRPINDVLNMIQTFKQTNPDSAQELSKRLDRIFQVPKRNE